MNTYRVVKCGDLWGIDKPVPGWPRAPMWLSRGPADELAKALNRVEQIADETRKLIGDYANVYVTDQGGGISGVQVEFDRWGGEDGPYLLLTDSETHYLLGIYDPRQTPADGAEPSVLIESKLNVEPKPTKTQAFYPAAQPFAVARWVQHVAGFVLNMIEQSIQEVTPHGGS